MTTDVPNISVCPAFTLLRVRALVNLVRVFSRQNEAQCVPVSAVAVLLWAGVHAVLCTAFKCALSDACC